MTGHSSILQLKCELTTLTKQVATNLRLTGCF